MSKARQLAELIGTQETSENVLAGRRNLMINGDFQIDQRGYSGTTSSTGTKYTVDRWYNYFATTITKIKESMDGMRRGGVNLNSASFGDTAQRLENNDLISGQQLTLSFWAKSISGSTDVRLQVGNNVDAGLINQNFTLTTSWQRFSFTLNVPEFSNINGTTYSYVAFQSNVVGINWSLANVQLELGSVATPFEHRSYGEELALCQRYYQVNNCAHGRFNPAGNQWAGSIGAIAPMRTAPSLTVLNPTDAIDELYVSRRSISSSPSTFSLYDLVLGNDGTFNRGSIVLSASGGSSGIGSLQAGKISLDAEL